MSSRRAKGASCKAEVALMDLKRIARYVTPETFPGLAKKVRSAIKSAQGALNNARRFERQDREASNA